jgi:hypothetical protein
LFSILTVLDIYTPVLLQKPYIFTTFARAARQHDCAARIRVNEEREISLIPFALFLLLSPVTYTWGPRVSCLQPLALLPLGKLASFPPTPLRLPARRRSPRPAGRLQRRQGNTRRRGFRARWLGAWTPVAWAAAPPLLPNRASCRGPAAPSAARPPTGVGHGRGLAALLASRRWRRGHRGSRSVATTSTVDVADAKSSSARRRTRCEAASLREVVGERRPRRTAAATLLVGVPSPILAIVAPSLPSPHVDGHCCPSLPAGGAGIPLGGTRR